MRQTLFFSMHLIFLGLFTNCMNDNNEQNFCTTKIVAGLIVDVQFEDMTEPLPDVIVIKLDDGDHSEIL